MDYGLGLVLGIVFTGLTAGGLFLPSREARELAWTGAAILGFWTVLLAILL